MNITFAVDEQLAERVRAAAQALGKSLNQVVREYLESWPEERNWKPTWKLSSGPHSTRPAG